MARRVLIVASCSAEVGDWTAYIGAVEGKNHDQEWGAVASHGDKAPEKVAALYFREIAASFKWRT